MHNLHSFISIVHANEKITTQCPNSIIIFDINLYRYFKKSVVNESAIVHRSTLFDSKF